MRRTWWRKLFSNSHSKIANSRHSAPRRNGFHPEVECLEDRRLLAAGSLLDSFGSGGIVQTGLNYTERNSIVAQPDGKIVMAGVGPANTFSVARFTATGELDPSFGTGGIATAQFTFPSVDRATGVALQNDGKIVVVGTTTRNSLSDFAVARFNTDGFTDSSFGNGGLLTIDFSNPTSGTRNDSAVAVDIQADGRIVIAGNSQAVGSNATFFAIARCLPDGSQDSDFSADGKQLVSAGLQESAGKTASDDSLTGMKVQPDNKIVLLGRTNIQVGGNGIDLSDNYALIRFLPDGTLDAGFGTGGTVVTDGQLSRLNLTGTSPFLDEPFGLLLQPDGKILVAGTSDVEVNAAGAGNGGTPGDRNFVLTRYTSSGALDAGGFNNDGFAFVDFSPNFMSGSQDQANALALQTDGKIVLAGLSNLRAPTTHFALARFNVDGTLDDAFGTHGKTTTIVNAANNESIRGIALLPDNNYIVSGVSQSGASNQLILAKYSGTQPGSVGFSASTFSVPQKNGTAIITVQRQSGSDAAVSVDFSTSDGTAHAGVDYVPTSGTLSFAPGEVSKVFTITLIPNGNFVAGGRTVKLNLSNPTGGATVGTQQATLTITQQAGALQFTAAEYDVSVSSGTANVVVQRVSGAEGSVSATVATVDGTARAGIDYTPVNTSVTFAPNETSKTVSIPILKSGGTMPGSSLTFNVILSNPTNTASLGTPVQATVKLDLAPATVNQRFVVQAYRDLLGRDPDQGGFTTFVNQLNAGGTTLQVAAALTRSQEFLGVQVQEMYRAYLKRDADPNGLRQFTAALVAGATLEQVGATLLGSAEYFQAHGSTTTGFLQALYADTLRRSIDGGALTAFTQALNAGVSTGQVAATVLSSTEYKQVLVSSYYQRYFHRAADPAGLNFFVNLLTTKVNSSSSIFLGDGSTTGQPRAVRDEDVITLFIGSQEYLQRLP